MIENKTEEKRKGIDAYVSHKKLDQQENKKKYYSQTPESTVFQDIYNPQSLNDWTYKSKKTENMASGNDYNVYGTPNRPTQLQNFNTNKLTENDRPKTWDGKVTLNLPENQSHVESYSNYALNNQNSVKKAADANNIVFNTAEEHNEPLAFNQSSFKALQEEARLEFRKIVAERIKKYLGLNSTGSLVAKHKRLRKPIKVEDKSSKKNKKGENKRSTESNDTFIKEKLIGLTKEEKTERKEKIESFTDFADNMFEVKLRNGAKSYVCPYENCKTELPSLSRIKRHYIVHTKIRPFKCLNKNCNKRFSRKDNMLQHYRIHCEHNGF